MEYPSLHRQSSYGVLRDPEMRGFHLAAPEPRRSACFDSGWSLFAGDWVDTDAGAFVATGTLNDGPHNRIHVLAGQYDAQGRVPKLDNVADGSSVFPQTRVKWDPRGLQQGSIKLLSSSDCLRMWNYDTQRGVLEAMFPLAKKSKRVRELAPLTSFDWCRADPALAITCSTDTMCTAWDLPTQQMRTYLIAHDSEVFDVKFLGGSADKFMSCGADGSARLFDLRSLARSTIMFTAPGPLLRVAPHPADGNLFAAVLKDSSETYIVDVRSPHNPVSVLQGHSGAVNSVDWAPEGHVLATGGDDCQALMWDLQLESPLVGAYTDRSEVNNVFWNGAGTLLGCVSGRTFQVVSR